MSEETNPGAVCGTQHFNMTISSRAGWAALKAEIAAEASAIAEARNERIMRRSALKNTAAASEAFLAIMESNARRVPYCCNYLVSSGKMLTVTQEAAARDPRCKDKIAWEFWYAYAGRGITAAEALQVLKGEELAPLPPLRWGNIDGRIE